MDFYAFQVLTRSGGTSSTDVRHELRWSHRNVRYGGLREFAGGTVSTAAEYCGVSILLCTLRPVGIEPLS
jgi:hypothetical protein